jgi:hypothetical protein
MMMSITEQVDGGVTLQTFSRKMPVSNLSQNIGYPDRVPVVSLAASRQMSEQYVNASTATSFQILSN